MFTTKKEKDELLTDIQERLHQIEESSKRKSLFDAARQTIIRISEERIKRLESLHNDTLYNDKSFIQIKKNVDALVRKIGVYEENGTKVTSGNKISNPRKLKT
ncbi:MAG: hypothetical protein MZV63_38295 [Marinilabiliales bacterium]|nr:hypothetical protein [Marinilabiliales bacterium]